MAARTAGAVDHSCESLSNSLGSRQRRVAPLAEPLDINVLGELEVRRGAKILALPPSRKTRALLGYLAMADRPVRRERLCELLWEVPDDPRGALRWSLSKLRGLAGDGASPIRADRETVALAPDSVRVDAHLVRSALANGLDRLSLPRLEELAGAFRGEFLEGLDLTVCPEFHAWVLAQRQQTAAQRRTILLEILSRLTERPDKALHPARVLAELEPLDEEAQARIVRLLAATGRRRDAERQYQAAALILEAGKIAETGALRRALEVVNAAPRTEIAIDVAATDDRPLVQEIRFCTAADGTRIAWSTAGEGPPIVKSANWLNHLEYDWESPVWRHLMRFLANGRTLVRYDERGNGLSDRELRDTTLDAFVNDLEAVVDSAGLETFPMLAISQGCAVAVAYAARHPHRVTRLVLHGGYAMGWRLRDDPDEIAAREAMLTLVRTGWGKETPAFRQVFTSLFFPEATAEQVRSFNELQVRSTSPDNAWAMLDAFSRIDVRPYLAQVKAPVLVTHCRGDLRISHETGRALAASIPGARFVLLDSPNHLMLEHEPAWSRFVAEVEAFLSAGA